MKKVVFVLLAVAFSAFASAQIINLSGNWTLNVTKSSLNEQFSLAPKVCNISQTDSELIVEKKLDFMGQETIITEKYLLDGTESSNPGVMESVKKSKVIFSDDKKIITITSDITTTDMGVIKLTEKYSMENENLIYQSVSSSPSFGEMSETAVYNKN